MPYNNGGYAELPEGEREARWGQMEDELEFYKAQADSVRNYLQRSIAMKEYRVTYMIIKHEIITVLAVNEHEAKLKATQAGIRQFQGREGVYDVEIDRCLEIGEREP